jgi:hypothetical protein
MELNDGGKMEKFIVLMVLLSLDQMELKDGVFLATTRMHIGFTPIIPLGPSHEMAIQHYHFQI